MLRFARGASVAASMTCSLMLAACGSTYPKVQQISQDDVTWSFSEPVEVCQFATGEWAVKAPVTVVGIAPDADGGLHGYAINPQFSETFTAYEAPFDARSGVYDAGFQPPLPLAVTFDASLVKTISNEGSCTGSCGAWYCYQCSKTAAVLTVLRELPPDGCRNYFRPAYLGTQKRLYPARIAADVLPKLAPVAFTQAIDAGLFVRMERRPFLDHLPFWTSDLLHPSDYLASGTAALTNEIALRLMMDDPIEAKMPLLLSYVQWGIDLFAIYDAGRTWPYWQAQTSGRLLPIMFAATMLRDTQMRARLGAMLGTDFEELDQLSTTAPNGEPLWGRRMVSASCVDPSNCCTERDYWLRMLDQYGTDCADPYSYVEGGGWVSDAGAVIRRPGVDTVQRQLAGSNKGTALAGRLMPQLYATWVTAAANDDFFRYVDRWVSHGVWTQPDPCAPNDGDAGGYGLTYGPAGGGGCIVDANSADGVGRFPTADGVKSTVFNSPFVDALWDAYRADAGSSGAGPAAAYDVGCGCGAGAFGLFALALGLAPRGRERGHRSRSRR